MIWLLLEAESSASEALDESPCAVLPTPSPDMPLWFCWPSAPQCPRLTGPGPVQNHSQPDPPSRQPGSRGSCSASGIALVLRPRRSRASGRLRSPRRSPQRQPLSDRGLAECCWRLDHPSSVQLPCQTTAHQLTDHPHSASELVALRDQPGAASALCSRTLTKPCGQSDGVQDPYAARLAQAVREE